MTDPHGALIERGMMVWNRFFYPSASDFQDLGSLDTTLKGELYLEMADCLRLTIEALANEQAARVKAEAERDEALKPDIDTGFLSPTDKPWERPVTASAIAEVIAELAVNDRSGLIQRVRQLIVRDRLTVRLRHEARAERAEAALAEMKAGLERIAKLSGDGRRTANLQAINRTATALLNPQPPAQEGGDA